MAENWSARVARMGEELTETGRVVLRSPALERGAECAVRLLLGAALSGGELLGGGTPFGVGLVACSGSGVPGLCALTGACLGYLYFRGLAEGVRYAAACVLVFSVAFAFYDLKVCRRSWFMPAVAAVMDAVTGFVYLSGSRWAPASAAFFLTEVVLAGASAYFYRLALLPYGGRRGEASLSLRQGVSLVFLLDTALISLAGVVFFTDLSLGRMLAVLLALTVAWTGGFGRGAAAGVALGVGMDLAAGRAPVYALAYGLSGLLTGAGWKQSRVFAALTWTVANAAVCLWVWEGGGRASMLYETFLATVLFLLLPRSALRQLRSALEREGEAHARRRRAEYVEERLQGAARAFRAVGDSLRAAFPQGRTNDADPSTVFDRTADRVCRKCSQRDACWEKDYVSTFNALNDALPAMVERGKGESGDFPGWFTGRCLSFGAFLRTANEELTALRYRRQYRERVGESRGAVRSQYETLAGILASASAELSAELAPDPVREKRLRQHLAALGLEGETAVYYDLSGHLRLEVEGVDLERLKSPAEVESLSRLMGLPLRLGEERPGRITLLQAEPLMAVAGAAARCREGQTDSGDAGTWFKREDGSVFVLLCDGMGSGEAARRESALAVRLLEEFLRTGMDAPAALRTVNSALALRNEETGAFTTVDLLRIDLFTGAGEVCKLGAAPTYVRRGAAVHRLTGTSLPAGLTEGAGADVTRLELKEGDWVVLLSDGVTDPEEDGWVRETLGAFQGESPKDLAQALMEQSEEKVGPTDDRTIAAVRLVKR